MLTTFFYTLALLSATPNAYYNGQPSSYNYEIEQKTTIAFYENHYEGTIYGYVDATLKYHGSYNVMLDTMNLQTGFEATLDIHYNGTIDEDNYGEVLSLPSQQNAFESVGHFRLTIEADQGIYAKIDRPILPDDDWAVYSSVDIWSSSGGGDSEAMSGQCDLQISQSDIRGLFKESGYLPWNLGNTLDYGETRYQDGYETGERQGYQNGLVAGGNQGAEATSNVFSMLTEGFSSVASFFELKVFGFLPLYWFFLAPVFVALITLLLRMVKH